MQLIADGLTRETIVVEMDTVFGSVESHDATLIRAIGLFSITELTKCGIREGFRAFYA